VSAANTFAQLLDDKELSDEERSEYIATLQTSLEKLTFLTNSLIKMSRLESGIISLKPEKNSLNDIVLQAVKTVYAKAKEKNITITFDCEQNFEAMLDFNWTAEAITNILDFLLTAFHGKTVRKSLPVLLRVFRYHYRKYQAADRTGIL